MKIKKLPILGICLFTGMLLFSQHLGAESTLMSVKKGEEGNRCWGVFTFSEKIIWIGVSQLEENKLALYFTGSAGSLNRSTIILDPVANRKIFIEQVSSDPMIFRSDILCEGNVPLAVLKKNRNLVISLNDVRLLGGRMIAYNEDVSPSPGRLVSVTPSMQNNQFMTTFNFDGTYDWGGYIRPAPNAAAILVRGAKLFLSDSDFSFEKSALQSVRLFPEEGEIQGFKAVLFFASASSFSIVRKPRSLTVLTQGTGEPKKPKAEKVTNLSDLYPSEQKSEELLEEIPLEWIEEGVDLTSKAQEKSELKNVQKEKKMEPPQIEKSTEKRKDSQIPLFETPDIRLAAREEEKIQRVEEKEEKSKKQIEEPEKPIAEVKTDGIPWDQKVSFEFNATPIKDALRLVAQSNDLNMVIGVGVEGEVTMDLKNVTLRQALEKIVHTHDCDYVVDGGIITVSSAKTVYSGGSITKVYRLRYADAENISKVIKQMVSNDSLVQVFHREFLDFTEAGKNRRDKNTVAVQGIRRSSILVVTDRPEKIREVDRVIQDLDKPPVQIMIESKLVETAPVHTNELGINWDKTITTALWGQNVLTGGDKQDYSLINTSPGQGGEWKMANLTASKYQAVLDFLNEKTDSKLKSNPKLLAMDNEESSISVGTTVPVPRIQRGFGGQGDMVTFDYKEVNIQLNVTPHLSGNDEIAMYVNPVIEEITGWVEYGTNRAPITDKRSVNSIVTVKNGETVVIGGLIKSQKTKTVQKVWLLGSLPLLGKLFQHEKYEDKQTDLMIFITPTIVQAG